MNKSFKGVPKRRRRRPRTIRKRIFVAGEGKSEVGHIALLQHFAKSQDLSTYLVKQRDTKGAGDPLSILERAINEAKQAEKGGKGFKHNKFLFVDCDTLGIKVARDEKVHALAVSRSSL